MANAGELLSRLVTVTLNRDGQADALDRELRSGGGLRGLLPTDGGPSAGGKDGAGGPTSRRHRPSIPPQAIILESIALKVLHAWLQNRHQTLYPLTMNLRHLGERERGLIVHAMAAAATADGHVDDDERRRMPHVLEKLGAGEAERRQFAEAVENPRPLAVVLREVQEADLGAFAYGAALIAANQRSRVNRLFLDYLAARLGLSAEAVRSLNRRYRA